MSVNSQYLKWFHKVERALWSFFALFGDLCSNCASQTLSDLSTGKRKGHNAWCCCMIDNQVHDNWESLDTVQKRFDRNWYESIRRPKGARTFGNGPCPALGDHGCRLKKCRPITCTTQLCSKMLVILKDRGLIRRSTQEALQIEDLITVPDILPDLYGTRTGRKVTQSEVEAYVSAVNTLAQKFARTITTRG